MSKNDERYLRQMHQSELFLGECRNSYEKLRRAVSPSQWVSSQRV